MFVWEDLPLRDVKSGKLTAAGWIPQIHKIMKIFIIFGTGTHFLQSSIRVFSSRETVLDVWYPFDVFSSPYYEMIIIGQHSLKCAKVKRCRPVCTVVQQEEVESIPASSYECTMVHCILRGFLNELENAMCLPLCGVLLFLQVSLCISAFSAVMMYVDGFSELGRQRGVDTIGNGLHSCNLLCLCLLFAGNFDNAKALCKNSPNFGDCAMQLNVCALSISPDI
ncbi:hypothetical protein ANN_17300 [Periplaneta americana]|uniref:Uncharacterized protein n=1 Tax=Periplaneta americana TaxID=6978 RepID=A0ABQ8STU9_PERAM|nr:hypothetical protein ANN_17300 [Periplaneta americana]